MIELSPGTDVYIYSYQADLLETRQSPTAKANMLLDIFYSDKEKVGLTLNGTKETKSVNPIIKDALLSK